MDNNQNSTQYQYTYYQNLYNMFGSYNPQLDSRAKELRRLGILGGIGFLLFSFMQNALAVFLRIFGLVELYQNEPMFEYGVGVIAPLFYLALPFAIIYAFYKPAEKQSVSVFEKPKSPQLFVYAVFAGIMLCYVGDFGTDIIGALAGGFGIEFSQYESQMPSGLLEKLLFVIEGAAMPALIEEFALRGVVMQPLRKFGDKFAIVSTALLFALLHGNMIQIPFAFVGGLVLGYFQIATGSIWTSIAIHFMNNFLSCIFAILLNKSESYAIVYYVVSAAFIVLGIIALILFRKNCSYRLKKDNSELKGAVKRATYMCSPAIILTIIHSITMTLNYTTITDLSGVALMIAAITVFAFAVVKDIRRLHNDTRIKYSWLYTGSIVITILAWVISTVTVFVSLLAVR